MAAPIDPPRAPLAPVARVLAEAALQRQNMLLGTERPGSAVAAPHFPDVPVPSGATPPVPLAALRPPLPVPADRVSLSEQGRSGAAGHAAGGDGGAPAPARLAGGAPAAALPEPVAGATAALWPAAGVPAPLRSLLGALVQQLTQAGAPQRVVAAQAWPASMQGVIDGSDAGGPALPALQTWLVGHGAVQTAEGERGLSLALRVPAAWAQALPAAAAAATAAAPGSATAALSVPFAGRPQALVSGLFALVLQPQDPAGARTSALLALDMAPWIGSAAATAYGRDLLQMRNDPWLHMALRQAAGPWSEDEEASLRRGGSEPCRTPGCPYAGRAPCEQPFCMALRPHPALPASAA